MAPFAPKAHLTAPVWNWGPFYTKVVESVKQGTWKAESVWPGLEAGIVDLAPFGPMVPKEVQGQVNGLKADIAAGKKKVFVGPIKDQKGEIKLADGVAAKDGELLGMTWFVEGVVGTTE